MRIFLLIFSMCVFYNTKAQIVTDRPGQSDCSSSVGNGDLQIESGLQIGFQGDLQASVRQILAPTMLFRYGLNQNVELRFISQYETLKQNNFSVQGISDLQIGTKIQLFQKEENNTEVAVLAHLVVPSGSKEFTADALGVVSRLLVSHGLNENVTLGYNIGYNYFEANRGDLTYTLSLGVGVNDKVGLFVEAFGEVIEFEELNLNFDAGFSYLINNNLQLDFSFGTGVNNRMNFLSTGISWLFAKQ